ncbi:MAG: hypothetical protein mread185_000598 [Mycoplasmataceae bacterium]|nr:MAG: hypothetical protein mread185_000598 [Mycoplasmataceae bacterium]
MKIGVEADKPSFSTLEEGYFSSSSRYSSRRPSSEADFNQLLWKDNEGMREKLESAEEQVKGLEAKSNRERRIIDKSNTEINLLVEEKEEFLKKEKKISV